MSRNRAVALTVAAAFVFSACTGAPTPTPGGPTATPGGTTAVDCKVGVSWNNFQQRRWAATDKPNMFKTIEDLGGTVLPDKDANLDTLQQITDVNTLIQQGAQVLVLLAQDPLATQPAIDAAKAANIPVIAYDRLAEDKDVLYITFDNVGVGVAEATAIMAKVPTGNYVVIKGDPGDPNASIFLRSGYDIAGLKAKVDAGEITILDEQFIVGWKPETAQTTMESIIDAANSANKKIDAILAENDSTAFGVVAALQSKNYEIVPVSGQDGDPANLNYVARGLQYVDVWKNSNELGKVAGYAAIQLCAGTAMADITLPADLIDPSVQPEAGLKVADFTTPGPDGKPDTGDENIVKSFILKPTPLTAENLQLAVDGGWITKEDLCKGVEAATAPAACK